jgi:hypothetical protein
MCGREQREYMFSRNLAKDDENDSLVNVSGPKKEGMHKDTRRKTKQTPTEWTDNIHKCLTFRSAFFQCIRSVRASMLTRKLRKERKK